MFLYKSINKKLGEKVTTVIIQKQKKHQSPRVWSYMHPCSWCEDDHEKGGGSALNYTRGAC